MVDVYKKDVKFLDCEERETKEKGLKYYQLTFLDGKDKFSVFSFYNNYTKKYDLYDKLQELDLKYLDDCTIALKIYIKVDKYGSSLAVKVDNIE